MTGSSNSGAEEEKKESPFFWRHARDSVLTPRALQMFQILASKDGQDFDAVKDAIDSEYCKLTGSTGDRHGGIIQTQVQAFREAGWVALAPSAGDIQRIQITPAGKQALALLGDLPDFLRAAPFFILELLSRFQLNNPSRPATSKNPAFDKELRESDIFPYWTLFKIMRSCGDRITSEELRRFVFRLKRQEDIQNSINQIQAFRRDEAAGLSIDELDKKYPKPLEGAAGEPKYIMGRLGIQVGATPAVIEKEGASTWILNRYYVPFVDKILLDTKHFQEHLTEETWMLEYGKPVEIDVQSNVNATAGEDLKKLADQVADDDEVLQEVKDLLANGSLAIVLTGPPGTSKSWYARRIAAKLAEGNQKRTAFVQFHPSYSYEDFVEGYVPKLIGDTPHFAVQKKVFLRLCEEAQKDSTLHVLVIDEINRGDASRIFGELLTYIEADYRERSFGLTYSEGLVSIPKNVLILGTMNPYDKSVADLDDALERRLSRITLDPSPKLLNHLLQAAGAEDQLRGRVVEFFVKANKLSRHGFGHALFHNVSDESGLIRLWNTKLRHMFERAYRFENEKMKETIAAFKAIMLTEESKAKLK